jgi:fructose-bisphosphate aldolase class 1
MERLQMNWQALMETARALVAGEKGLLAMDESNPTCDRRFAEARLSAMNLRFKASGSRPPWALAFSFARAIQQPALEIWAGK